MKSLLTKIYLYRIFSELMLLYPLYTVMFAERGRLDMLQISTLLGVWSVIILLFEIPSGALADKYSRRNLLGLAQLIRGVGYGLWVFFPTFTGFLAGLALWGIGRSLTSGTFEALVFDELKATGKQALYAKVIGRSESLALLFSFGSTLAAAPVFMWLGYDGVLWFSVTATILAAATAFTLPQKKRQTAVEAPAYLTIIRQAASEVKHNPDLLKLIIFGVFVGMLFRIFDEYASLILSAATVQTALIPVVSTLVFLPVLGAGLIAYRLEKLRQVFFMLVLIGAGGALIIAGHLLGPVGVASFAVFMLLVKIAIIIFGAKVQHAITGSTRATIMSINNFGVEVAAVGAFFTYGILARLGDTKFALIVFGALIILVGSTYLLLTRGRLLRKVM